MNKMANLTRVVLGKSNFLQRAISTTAVKRGGAVIEFTQEDLLPIAGNREIVGFGVNGYPSYVNSKEAPFPALRWKENTPEVLKLRQSEKSDWKALSMEDKKALYRASFQYTFSEMDAPNGEWKVILAGTLLGFTLTGLMMTFQQWYVYPELPHSLSEEWQLTMAKKMVLERSNHADFIGYEFDYEKHEWKK